MTESQKTRAAEALARLIANQEEIEDLKRWQTYHVREARKDGASWGEIGNALGLTRQAVQQKYG